MFCFQAHRPLFLNQSVVVQAFLEIFQSFLWLLFFCTNTVIAKELFAEKLAYLGQVCL